MSTLEDLEKSKLNTELFTIDGCYVFRNQGDKTPVKISDLCSGIREKSSLTRQEVAILIGTEAKTYKLWEQATTQPKKHFIEKLLAFDDFLNSERNSLIKLIQQFKENASFPNLIKKHSAIDQYFGLDNDQENTNSYSTDFYSHDNSQNWDVISILPMVAINSRYIGIEEQKIALKNTFIEILKDFQVKQDFLKTKENALNAKENKLDSKEKTIKLLANKLNQDKQHIEIREFKLKVQTGEIVKKNKSTRISTKKDIKETISEKPDKTYFSHLLD